VTAINAFVLIGLDLALRDWLHVRLKVWQMGALIAFTGLLTFALNPAAGQIALASAAAFTAAALVDWATFARLKGSPDQQDDSATPGSSSLSEPPTREDGSTTTRG
jgi:hypothetical protein